MSIKYKSDVVIIVSIIAVVVIAIFMRTNISGEDITGKVVINHAPVFEKINKMDIKPGEIIKTVQAGQKLEFSVFARDPDYDYNDKVKSYQIILSYFDLSDKTNKFYTDATGNFKSTGNFVWQVPVTVKPGDYNAVFLAVDNSNSKGILNVKIRVTAPPATVSSTSPLPASASPLYYRYVWQTNNGKYTKVGLSFDSGGNIVCSILEYTDGSQACREKYADSNLVLGTCENSYYSTKIGCFSTVGNKKAKKCDCALSSSGLTGTQNKPPIFDPVETQIVQPGKKLEFVISVTDPDGPVTYSILNPYTIQNNLLLLDGGESQTFSPQTRTFSWNVPSNPKYPG